MAGSGVVSSLLVILACVPLPCVCRWRLLRRVGRSRTAQTGDLSTWRLLGVGALQDLWLGLELLIVILVVGLALTSAVGAGLVSAALFALVQGYLLLDHYLHVRVGLRMTLTLVAYVREAPRLLSSARRLGYQDWVRNSLFLLAASLVLFPLGYTSWGVPALFPGLLPLTVVLAAAVILPMRVVANTALQFAGNTLFLDQWKSLSRLWSRRAQPLAARGRLGTAVEVARSPLGSTSEKSTGLFADYPLFRMTEGFVGPTQFEWAAGPMDRPHLVFLFLESFRAADVGVLGGRHGVSPVFDRLALEGVLFTNFYANGVQTTRAVEASLYGMLPRYAARSIQEAPRDLRLIGIADLLRPRRYRAAHLHNGSLALLRQGEFFRRYGYDAVHGREDIVKILRRAEGLTSWGVHDEYLMRFAADWVRQQDAAGIPTFSTVFTMTNHHPWVSPPAHRSPPLDDVPPGEYRDYLRTFHYSDYCLGLLVELFREYGLFDKTLFFILADTGQPMGERNGNFMLLNQLHEEGQRIPLLILAPGRWLRPAVVHDPGSQVDLLLTVMDLLELTGPHHAMGESLRRKVPDRTVFMNNPFGEGYWGARSGRYKYLWSDQRQKDSLFDLDLDPGEHHDRAAADPERVARFRQRVEISRRLFASLDRENRFAPPGYVPAR